MFRADADARGRAIAACVPPLAGKSLCDVGCGDGELAAGLVRLRGQPGSLTLLDIAPSAVRRAQARLLSLGVRTSTRVADVLVDGIGGPYDIAIAVGLSDYHDDWDGLIACLRCACRGVCVIDFPKSNKLRNLLRRAWLSLHGVRIRTSSRGSLVKLLDRHTNEYRLIETRYNWVVTMAGKVRSGDRG